MAAATPTAGDSIYDNDNETEKVVKEIIETLRKCTVGVEDFQGPDSQEALFQRINSLIDNFKSLGRLCNSSNFDVPVAVLEYIDQAKNPALFTKELLEECIRSNDSTAAKIKTLHTFGQVLNEEVAKEFPEEYEQYLRLREARRLAAVAVRSAVGTGQ